MIRNRIRESKKYGIQIDVVSKQFVENGIDLALVGAGQTLYASLEHARKRVTTDKYYIAKGIEYRLDLVEKKGKLIKLAPRYALIAVIQGDDKFWQAWVKQNEIYERTGLEVDRPTIHRLNPDGHYELGNIAVVPRGEHLQEHAQPVIVLDTDAVTITTYKSQTEFQKVESVSRREVEKMNKAFKEDKSSLKE